MASKKKRKTADGSGTPKTEEYRHPGAESPLRPDAGTQSQFRKKKPPVKYRYDSSLSPSLEWDGKSSAREKGEWLIGVIEKGLALGAAHTFNPPEEFKSADGSILLSIASAREALEQLKRMSKPFLNWAGKAERLSFDVPTLPLFVHERLSTKAIIETLQGHKKDTGPEQMSLLFGDPQRPVADQVLKAYEYKDKWVNRMILGDSLVTMNSLLKYEGMGGQVQMIYIDPPYGIKFGSNFQPFVRKRDVTHGDDEDMTREPEMVKAYRDTWELGLHSYLTYMRDRLLLTRELLTESGSCFVQISDENLHHVRELMDGVFGKENFISLITFKKKNMPLGTKLLEQMHDYILWYARSKESLKFRRLFTFMDVQGDTHWNFIEFPNGEIRQLKPEEINNHGLIPKEASIFRFGAMFSAGVNDSGFYDIKVDGDIYKYPAGKGWKTPIDSMKKLITLKRVMPWEKGKTLGYKIKLSDYPVTSIDTVWDDTALLSNKSYVVQTSTIAIQKCLLMTTDPGDLVIDPTCGSGTTAYVAEQWGRRWITMDTSRVPLALARQRLLTATYDYFQLKDETLGPAGGFVYKRKQNNKGEEVGGIVPHLTLGAIANNEPPKEEILVDKPEKDNSITRVTGPFCFEATIPTPVDLEGGEENAIDMEEHGSFVDRMLEVLRRSPVLQVGGGKIVTFKNVRPPAKTLSLSAEAIVGNGSDKTIAIVFGPENGAVSERTALEALKEAHLKNYSHLYVIGFSIQANARVLIEKSSEMGMLSSTYIQATPDIMMGDLLKNMRSSQIFSVCGMPEIKIHKVKTEKNAPQKYQVELLGLDVFDPGTMETLHRKGDDVPMWMLDTDHNGLSFHVCQAFFPRTSAWDNLKKSLKMTYEESVWDHLAGSISAPFEAGEHEQISVKVIDDRGNELVVVKAIKEAGK